MRSFFTRLAFFLSFTLAFSNGEGRASTCSTEDLEVVPFYDCGGIFSNNGIEEQDPLEPMNRMIFCINQGLDYIIIEPIAWAYSEIIPEYGRDRISNILRNLNEPVVLVNNLLQGELEDARTTIWRFVFNSTLGIAGMFDVSTDLCLPYKKEDFGLTLASWGFGTGPYLVLPILGPSNFRDGWGRLGDFAFDPITWLTFGMETVGRSAIQVLDAKTDNIKITDDLKKNSIDYYASIRTWYTERRKALMIAVPDRQAIDTPRPDEDEDESISPSMEEDLVIAPPSDE